MKIFFDVDGVLIDGWHANPALRKPWDATVQADLGIDRDAFQRLFFNAPAGKPNSAMFECITGRRKLKDALADVLPQVGYRGSVESFICYWFERDSNVNPDVFRLLTEIRERSGNRMYVATGQEHHRARYLWNDLGFSNYFDGMFYSAEIGHAKKDLRFFEAINRSLGIEPSERPLFFDDQPEIIELAKRAGWDGTTFTSIRDIREHSRLRHLWR